MSPSEFLAHILSEARRLAPTLDLSIVVKTDHQTVDFHSDDLHSNMSGERNTGGRRLPNDWTQKEIEGARA